MGIPLTAYQIKNNIDKKLSIKKNDISRDIFNFPFEELTIST
jgi:hypothetical protein